MSDEPDTTDVADVAPDGDDWVDESIEETWSPETRYEPSDDAPDAPDAPEDLTDDGVLGAADEVAEDFPEVSDTESVPEPVVQDEPAGEPPAVSDLEHREGEPLGVETDETDESEEQPEESADAVREPVEPTGHQAVDAVLSSLEGLETRPVSEHVAVFEQAHAGLRQALDDGHAS